jgi:DNA-binding beta-propeller fold protein YncE
MTTLFSLAWIVPGLAMMAAAAPPLRLQHKVEMPDVDGRIDHLSIDPKTGRLFMAALGHYTIEVIDTSALRRSQTIRGVPEPQGVLFVPAANRLFVASGRDGGVRVFDGTTLEPLLTVPFGDDADNLRLDPASGRIWVGYGAGALAAMGGDGTKAADIPVGGHPESFQLEKSGSRVFANVPSAGKIAVVDRARSAVIANWTTGDATANYPMALDEGHHRLVVVCRHPARLIVLDTATGANVTTRPTLGDADDVFYDAAARKVYVSGGEGAIATYRQTGADAYEELARTPTVKGARTSFFSPDQRRLFLAVRRQEGVPAAIWIYGAPEE